MGGRVDSVEGESGERVTKYTETNSNSLPDVNIKTSSTGRTNHTAVSTVKAFNPIPAHQLSSTIGITTTRSS